MEFGRGGARPVNSTEMRQGVWGGQVGVCACVCLSGAGQCVPGTLVSGTQKWGGALNPSTPCSTSGSPCSFQHPWVQRQGAEKLPCGKKQRREGCKHRSTVSKSGKEVEPWSLRQARLQSSSFLPQGWHRPASTLPLRPKLKAKRPPSAFPRSESQGTTEGKGSHQ